ncbi:hypothetical protein AcW1_001646 [Taiwanofungus camphoratus]|nr:hypothetical protein AcW1_001646 [Antrodia cinnamomea]
MPEPSGFARAEAPALTHRAAGLAVRESDQRGGARGADPATDRRDAAGGRGLLGGGSNERALGAHYGSGDGARRGAALHSIGTPGLGSPRYLERGRSRRARQSLDVEDSQYAQG